MGGVEDAAAVSEAALIARERDKGVGFEIEGADSGDGAGDFLAIGAYILDGSAADRTGDSGEAFDAADSLLTEMKNKGVPFGSSGSGVLRKLPVGG